MRDFFAVIGFLTVGYWTLYAIGTIVDATPEWLASAIMIGFLVGLPILALVKIRKMYFSALKEEGKL